MEHGEIARVQRYLREKFGTDRIKLTEQSAAGDSIEVQLGDEFIGIVSKDEEDNDLCYNFHMAILDEDLPDE